MSSHRSAQEVNASVFPFHYCLTYWTRACNLYGIGRDY
jgi:hypothetical protein